MLEILLVAASVALVPPPPPSAGPPAAPTPLGSEAAETAEATAEPPPVDEPATAVDEAPPVREPEPTPTTRETNGGDEATELELDPYGLSDHDAARRAGRGVQISGAVIVGAGMALGVVALVYLAKTNKARARLDAAIDSGDADARVQPIADVELHNRSARIFGIASAATIVVGTTVFAIGMRRASHRRYVQASTPHPVLAAEFAGFAWRGEF